ncbi:MAG TPA: DUF4412 domain-containing protein [Polyangiaceae bacterium]
MKRRLLGSFMVLALAANFGCSKLKPQLTADGSAAPSAAPSQATGSPLDILNGFEGEIGLAIAIRERAGTLKNVSLALQVKENKVRVDMPPDIAEGRQKVKGYGVLNTPEKKLFFVMDEPQKQVVLLDLNKVAEDLKSFSKGVGQQNKPEKPHNLKVTKTGIMDKVAGYSCENWDVFEEARKAATLCVASQGVSWFHFPTLGIPKEYEWVSELFDGKHFPLRAIIYAKAGGGEEARIELTKIDKKPLAASLFQIPVNYPVMDLATMLGGLAKGIPPGMAAAPGPMGAPSKRK